MNPRYMTPEQIEEAILDGRLSVSGASGDRVLRGAEGLEAYLGRVLQGNYQKLFGKQQDALDFLGGKMRELISNPTGYSPDALTAMRSGATEGTARSYAQAEQALHNNMASRGGNGLPSGVDDQLEAENANAGAAQNVQSQNDITLANENQKQQNFWNAVNGYGKVADEENPIPYANSATGANVGVADMANAFKGSQSGFWSSFKNAFGSSLGSTFGSFGRH